MRTPFRVRLAVFVKHLAFQVESQPDEWREADFKASNGWNVFGCDCPDISLREEEETEKSLYIRGERVVHDFDIDIVHCSDPAKTRDEIVAALSEFVAHMDGEEDVGETCQKCEEWILRDGDDIWCCMMKADISGPRMVLRNGWPPVPDSCPKRSAKSKASKVVGPDTWEW